jgi:ribosomal protein S18 acetylase RimI-like enzyme
MQQPVRLIRPAGEADLPAIAAIHMASWQDAYRDVVPEAVLLRRSVADCLTGWRLMFADQGQNISVACTPEGRIHGFCCAGPTNAARNAPFAFEVFGLHVSPRSRRLGIGASLLRHALARASAQEGSAIVWTLEALSLSRRFYEREGGRPVKAGVCTIDGIEFAEVAYGWTDLSPFKRAD